MFWTVTLDLFQGFGITVALFFLTLLFALPLGLLIAFAGMSKIKIISGTVKFLVWIIRGTPLMLQIIAVYYVPGLVFGMTLPERMNALVFAFVLNYSCYFSEIYRSGIQSVPSGQYEAGLVLGMTKKQIFTKIILFQVIRRITPPMGNEIITLVKDTSLARVITVAEILYVAFTGYVAKGFIWPLFYTAVYYLLFVGILTLLFNYLEKKMNFYKL